MPFFHDSLDWLLKLGLILYTGMAREYLMITNSVKELASNSMDQHSYSITAYLLVVGLDCIKFDYINFRNIS